MSVDSSSTHRRRSVAARLVRLAAASAAAAVALATAAAWAHGDAAQHRCIHDSMQARVVQSVAEQRLDPSRVAPVGLPYVAVDADDTAAERSSGVHTKQWGTPRIAVFTYDFTDEHYFCSRVGQNVSMRNGNFAICTADDVLTYEKRDIIRDFIIPQALQLHTRRLKVQQVQDTWKVKDMVGVICGSFNVPSLHTTDGLRDKDFVIYVASVPAKRGVMAWATSCQVFSDGRPAVGVINISPAKIVPKYYKYLIRTAAHEIAHTLGFSKRYFKSAGILTRVPNVRGKDFKVPVINSTTVVAKVREHYGCNTLEHLELEDQGGAGSAESHIKMRNAQDELMVSAAAAGYYTALTMAVFQDLGFYQVDFSRAEAMSWGKDAGCAFLSEKCMEKGVTKWPSMFCSGAEEGLRCPSNRMGLGYCPVTNEKGLPEYFQYFADPSLSGISSFMDYCPIMVHYADGSCAQDASKAKPWMKTFNVFSKTARCLDGDFRTANGSQSASYRALCADVKCDTLRRTYTIQVNGGTYVKCVPGTQRELINLSTSFQKGGYITCPPYEEVCQRNVLPPEDISNAATGHRGTVPVPLESL
ncbi:GP63, leishmanolysin [Leishmania tarentolae]|uniref:Leishmanolysin n=1 Tax=Leishmania tarentolae TaxID=5689 RepID=A0A640K9T3_LEITA|nr:GP63, leishmanolysin [Leishmania tarentolae]